MANRVVVIFAEGQTEIEFYKAVISFMHNKMEKSFECSLQWVDVGGIGNYKDGALRKGKKILRDNADKQAYAVLCHDTDVFDFNVKPPVNMTEVKAALKDAGFKRVSAVKAKHSIEDWFLTDYNGVLSYLKLSASTKRPSGKGQDALKALFRKAGKIYSKGCKTDGLIEKLDIEMIVQAHCADLKPLCSAIGADCALVCCKK